MVWEQRLRRIVHFELDWMWRVLERDQFRDFKVDVAVNEVVVEHTARSEETAIFVEFAESLPQRAAHRRNALEFRRRQIVQVLVNGRARIQLVLDDVETGTPHRPEREI